MHFHNIRIHIKILIFIAISIFNSSLYAQNYVSVNLIHNFENKGGGFSYQSILNKKVSKKVAIKDEISVSIMVSGVQEHERIGSIGLFRPEYYETITSDLEYALLTEAFVAQKISAAIGVGFLTRYFTYSVKEKRNSTIGVSDDFFNFGGMGLIGLHYYFNEAYKTSFRYQHNFISSPNGFTNPYFPTASKFVLTFSIQLDKK